MKIEVIELSKNCKPITFTCHTGIGKAFYNPLALAKLFLMPEGYLRVWEKEWMEKKGS